MKMNRKNTKNVITGIYKMYECMYQMPCNYDLVKN